MRHQGQPDRGAKQRVGERQQRLVKRGAQEGRTDDTPESVATRLSLYRSETEPLVERYRAKGNVVGIHGDRGENEVFSEIQEALEQAAART